MFRLNWAQPRPRPTARQVQAIWARAMFAPAAPSEEGVPTAFLNAVREVFVNGGAHFARFHVAESDVLDWFVSRNLLDEVGFIPALLASPAFDAALPELAQGKEPGKAQWQEVSSLTLDGEWARVLVCGGAYESYEGAGPAAKRIGALACEQLFGDRWEDMLLRTTRQVWSDWFFDIAWDYTWVGVDKVNRSAWVLVMTDTD